MVTHDYTAVYSIVLYKYIQWLYYDLSWYWMIAVFYLTLAYHFIIIIIWICEYSLHLRYVIINYVIRIIQDPVADGVWENSKNDELLLKVALPHSPFPLKGSGHWVSLDMKAHFICIQPSPLCLFDSSRRQRRRL